jgi:CheY-like chemotaxis protein
MPFILVVDDDESTCDALQRLLSRMGYAAACATNGYEALDVAGTVRPDVIVLDWMMPGIDGLEVLRRLRADGDEGRPGRPVQRRRQPRDARRSQEPRRAGLRAEVGRVLPAVRADRAVRAVSTPRYTSCSFGPPGDQRRHRKCAVSGRDFRTLHKLIAASLRILNATTRARARHRAGPKRQGPRQSQVAKLRGSTATLPAHAGPLPLREREDRPLALRRRLESVGYSGLALRTG